MSTNPGPSTPVLSLIGVSKRFGAVQALQDVSVECRAGEIHAVVGENGSGKSTLLGIASGVLAPDEGSVEIDGERLNAAHAAEARRLGLGMAYQTYSHVVGLSVGENLLLSVPPEERPPFRERSSWAAARLREFESNLPPDAPVGALSLAQRQFLEVVKALLSKPKVLLLDEPTTALGPGEIERLHGLVLSRAEAGVGVVYVSHRLPEVLGIASRITVLRDGHGQGTYEAERMSEQDLVALMIGRPLQLAFPERNGGRPTDVLLDVSGLRGDRFGPIDFMLHKGEIIGLAGAEGNGQHELLRCLGGIARASGSVRCLGQQVDLRAPYAALRAGIVLLSGDRIREALFPVLGVRSNTTIQVLRRFSRAGWLRRGKEGATVTESIRQLKVRTPSIEQPVRFLSGGNQQKVALTRTFLRGGVRIILADEPTQGVDIASRFDIYQALRAKTAEGVSIIVKSSDPLELAGLCDRVLVISRGRVADEIPREELSEQRIVEAIVGSARILPASSTQAGASRES
jgi:ribose transport system ATP-binding protein